MERKKIYCSYDSYSVVYDLQTQRFSVSAGGKAVLRNAVISLSKQLDGQTVSLSCYSKTEHAQFFNSTSYGLSIQFSGAEELQDAAAEFEADRNGVSLRLSALDGYVWHID